MKKLLLTAVTATCALAASADDSTVTNAPNFSLVDTKEVSTNTVPAGAVDNRNAPPQMAANSNYATTNYSNSTTETSWRSSSDSPQTMRVRDDYFDRRFEVGAIFGEPTGASLKYWFNDTFAIDGVLGWAFHQEDINFYVQSDVLYHFHDLFHVSRGELLPYVGLGVSAKFRDHNRDDIWGLRLPIGVEYMFDHCPVSLFGEVAPVLDVSPGARGDFSVGVGARYRF